MADSQDAVLQRVMREHGSMLARFAAGFERDRHQRDDLMQDIMIALWQALPSFRGEASLKTFVMAVAHRRCASHVMKATREPRHEDLDESLADTEPGPEAMVRLSQQQERLLAAVRSLPLGQRQLALLALEGMRYEEIAATLGISDNNVGVRLNRAKAALKALLEET